MKNLVLFENYKYHNYDTSGYISPVGTLNTKTLKLSSKYFKDLEELIDGDDTTVFEIWKTEASRFDTTSVEKYKLVISSGKVASEMDVYDMYSATNHRLLFRATCVASCENLEQFKLEVAKNGIKSMATYVYK